MDDFINGLQEKWKQIILGLFGVILVLIVLLVTQNMESTADVEDDIYAELLAEEEIKADVEQVIEEPLVETQESPVIIIVDVKGAVKIPGVYQMDTGSRMIDAISKAGGLTETAEQNAVNFAQVVEDQMVIYVPEIGEEGTNIPVATPSTGTGSEQEESGSSKVNINTADKTMLMTLNGIGESKATNILNYREENGLFQSIEEIKNVSGIGDATFENLKERIIVSP